MHKLHSSFLNYFMLPKIICIFKKKTTVTFLRQGFYCDISKPMSYLKRLHSRYICLPCIKPCFWRYSVYVKHFIFIYQEYFMDFSNNIYVLIVDVILQYISSAWIDCETFNPSRLQVIFSTLFNGVIIVFPQKKN